MNSEAYKRGRDEYWEWFDKKKSTCIDGTGPTNPYQEGTADHDDWENGRWDERNQCVLIEMGR